MSILTRILQATQLPHHVILGLLRYKITHRIHQGYLRIADKLKSSYESRRKPDGHLECLLTPICSEPFEEYSVQIEQLAQNYLQHKFDLLGSGWVKVEYGMDCNGLESHLYPCGEKPVVDQKGSWLIGRINRSNSKNARRVWRLIRGGYCPIDWHRDFKSGFRWRENIWFKDIRFGQNPGADIKVPWELARMQHLPMLAWAYGLAAGRGQSPKAQIYAEQFRNQVLDFIAVNPPRYGVNWSSTMDVAIRLVNWLITYDLFYCQGATFDDEFQEVFEQSVYTHARHCASYLEYSYTNRNNHYLAGIAGLFFAAVYLPNTLETTRWLAFTLQELISEMRHQFHPDGSNFEASTSYHRLALEIMLYCSAVCLVLPKKKRQSLQGYKKQGQPDYPPLKSKEKQEYNVDAPSLFPQWYWDRLKKGAEFTINIAKPGGTILQTGDNDSGRFIKLWPAYKSITVNKAILLYQNLTGCKVKEPAADYWDEEILDHSHIAGITGVLFNKMESAKGITPETIFMKTLLNGRRAPNVGGKVALRGTNSVPFIYIGSRFKELQKRLEADYGKPVRYRYPATGVAGDLRLGLLLFSYPDFGLYIYKSPRLYLAVRCGGDSSGHGHNDQLTAELTIDGIEYCRDPGSYVYTPLPDRRNFFRSTAAHFTPRRGQQEQRVLPKGLTGLFQLPNPVSGRCLHFSPAGFAGMHSGFDRPVYRIIRILADGVEVADFGSDPITEDLDGYSPGYGKLIRSDGNEEGK